LVARVIGIVAELESGLSVDFFRFYEGRMGGTRSSIKVEYKKAKD
jgi:hypothetical protein